MRDVALVPERDVLESDKLFARITLRDAADALRDDRIALVRHRARTFLTFRETLLRFANFRALPVTNIQGKLIERRSNDRERVKYSA